MRDPFVLVVAGVLGLMFGSFLNVCIVRLPVDESIVTPRSKCPKCGTPVAWFDNLPVISWLVLRGRCRGCRAPISIRYPLVELGVGGIWLLAAWAGGLSLDALRGAIFGTILLGIALTDLEHYIIPDEFSVGGLVIGLLLAAAGGWGELGQSLLGAAVGFGVLFLVAWAGEKIFGQEAMGGGDIKMMAMVGAFVGWQGVGLTIFGGALLGTIVFIPILATGRKPLVPFGVFLAAAAGLVFAYGPELMNWYVGLVLS